MSEFIRSIQATNSPRSVGRFGSRMRWITTPPRLSCAGDSSPPRVRTWTSTSRSTSASESLRTCRASPPSISGGYSQERIRTRVIRVAGSRLQERSEAEVRGEGSHTRIGGAVAVYGLQHRPRVIGGPLVGVVAGLLALVEERPVARLGGEELARGALKRPRLE